MYLSQRLMGECCTGMLGNALALDIRLGVAAYCARDAFRHVCDGRILCRRMPRIVAGIDHFTPRNVAEK